MRSLIIVACFIFLGSCYAKERVENGGIYMIVNLAANASLTSSNNTNNSSVILEADTAKDSQRWKAEEAGIYWIFRPKDNERLILTVDNRADGLYARIFTKGLNRQWNVTSLKNKGEDAVQLINHKYDSCLQGKGLNNQVVSAPCDNNDDFVWLLKKVG